MDLKASLKRLRVLKNEISDIINNLEANYPNQEDEEIVEEEVMESPEEEEQEPPAEDDYEEGEDEDKQLRIQSLSSLMAKKLKR